MKRLLVSAVNTSVRTLPAVGSVSRLTSAGDEQRGAHGEPGERDERPGGAQLEQLRLSSAVMPRPP